MEPYPTPNLVEQDLPQILKEVAFADRIIFGRTNYNKVVSAYPGVKAWYHERAQEVIDFCSERGIEYYIKKGTQISLSDPVAVQGVGEPGCCLQSA